MIDLYCSMIHGGLSLDFKNRSEAFFNHCCLRSDRFALDNETDYWNSSDLHALRMSNNQNQWDPGCSGCERLEKNGLNSFRVGMNNGLGIQGKRNLSGPARIDLMFDISCNLACRTCGAESSTFWQHHLKEHGEWNLPIFTPRNKNKVIETLQKLDLSNLRQVVFCGGETLLGQEYWDVSRWLVQNVPNVKHQLMLCFQTNGTQSIHPRNFDIIESVNLVKLHVSLDAINEKFEYLRWPAEWNQVVQNLRLLKENLPSNVMFLVEETLSVFNLYYQSELEDWIAQNYTTNREGDVINHTRHMASGIFSLKNCSQEYVDAISSTCKINMVPKHWKEDVGEISKMIAKIKKIDSYRNQSFEKTFPELHQFYLRFW